MGYRGEFNYIIGMPSLDFFYTHMGRMKFQLPADWDWATEFFIRCSQIREFSINPNNPYLKNEVGDIPEGYKYYTWWLSADDVKWEKYNGMVEKDYLEEVILGDAHNRGLPTIYTWIGEAYDDAILQRDSGNFDKLSAYMESLGLPKNPDGNPYPTGHGKAYAIMKYYHSHLQDVPYQIELERSVYATFDDSKYKTAEELLHATV